MKEKAPLRISKLWIIVIVGIIAVIVANILDGRHLSSESPFTRLWVVVPTYAIIGGLWSVYIWKVLIHRSPQRTYPGGHDSWMPLHDIPKILPREKEGFTSLPWAMNVLPRHTFAASGLHSITKGGRNGFVLWPDLPGVTERVGENLKINCLKPVVYTTPEEKRDIWWLINDLKDICNNKGWKYDDDSPVEIWIVPFKEGVFVDPKTISKLVDKWDGLTYMSMQMTLREDQFDDLRMGQEMTRQTIFPTSQQQPTQPQRSVRSIQFTEEPER